jgi:hypothetical protein
VGSAELDSVALDLLELVQVEGVKRSRRRIYIHNHHSLQRQTQAEVEVVERAQVAVVEMKRVQLVVEKEMR